MIFEKAKRKSQAIHPSCEKGKVTVNRKSNEVLSQEVLNSIFKQTRWK